MVFSPFLPYLFFFLLSFFFHFFFFFLDRKPFYLKEAIGFWKNLVKDIKSISCLDCFVCSMFRYKKYIISEIDTHKIEERRENITHVSLINNLLFYLDSTPSPQPWAFTDTLSYIYGNKRDGFN